MFFRKKENLQRLNLEFPKPLAPLTPPAPAIPMTPASPAVPVPEVDPAKLQAVNQRAKEILDSGRIPEWLFVCALPNGLLTFMPGPGQPPMVLLFSTPFAARDYLLATKTAAQVRQFKVEALAEAAQSWLTSGAGEATIDRCPRCPQFVAYPLQKLTQFTPADFAKIWAYHRASRLVLSEIRVRSAMAQMGSGNHAAARTDLEYVRDHFDCGVPYLHQAIALISGMLQDEPAKAAALDRLKEFGPQFSGPVEFSPQLVANVMVGLSANFGILNLPLLPLTYDNSAQS